MALFAEQVLNGLQFGLLVFLMGSGLTLIFGIMGQINLAHGSLFMMGAYLFVQAERLTGSIALAVPLALLGVFLIGIGLELTVFRRLYGRNHLYQVVATFGLILIFNEAVRTIWGVAPQFAPIPPALSGSVRLGSFEYPVYRLAVIVVGAATAAGLFLMIQRTRLGSLIRAGAEDREMVAHLGIDIGRLFTLVFGLGALLAGLAGIMAAPILSVRPGMGEQILILTFVAVVVGGIGSIHGALAGAAVIGFADTLGRAYLGDALALVLPPAAQAAATSALLSTLIFLVMAVVLVARPRGLVARRQR